MSYNSETSECSYSSEYSYNSDECKIQAIVKTVEIDDTTSDYKFSTLDNIQLEIDLMISNLQLETDYSYDKLLNILILNNWNNEYIYSLYLDGKFETDDNIINFDNSECSICYDTLTSDNVIQINDCCHILCKDCFSSNYSVNLNLKCPMYKCENICYLSTILKYINEDMKIKYKNYIIDHYININKLIIYCPSQPFCGNVIIRNMYSDSFIVKCKCDETICFKCKKITDNHAPATCLMMKKWDNMVEQSSFTYINKVCKQCPWCDRICEKISGCNFLTCQTIKSKHWCWLCGGKVYHTEHDFSSIKGHTCPVNKEIIYTNHEDYTFYINKYENHQQSINLDKTKFNKFIITNQNQLTDRISNNIVKYYKLLITSRTYIKNSYIYIYNEAYQENNKNVKNQETIYLINIELIEYILEFYASALDAYIDNINNIDINDIEVSQKFKLLTTQLNSFMEYLEFDN